MKGDHIYVDRGFYTHHGIELGGGQVVHYSGEPGSSEPGRIVISTLSEFLQGGEKRVRRYRKGTALPKKKSVELALSRVGEEKYHLVFNNCEHFACWCRIGQARSEQVFKAAMVVARALGNGPAIVADSVIRMFKRRKVSK